MPAIPQLNEASLEAIAHVLGHTTDGLTGSEISRLLSRCEIDDPQPSMTKWIRLFEAFRGRQNRDGCANNVLAFVQAAMEPVRYQGKRDYYEGLREQLNEALAFCGFQLAADGKLRETPKASTLSEAQARASRLHAALVGRRVHHEVLRFCKAELLEDNSFHAVFEATKSVAQRIRDLTGLTSDGAELVDAALGVATPRLAINTLRTEPEQSEQKGFSNLLKGIFGLFRNVPAHAPRIMWRIEEEDALDLFSMLSYIHRRLDTVAVVPKISA